MCDKQRGKEKDKPPLIPIHYKQHDSSSSTNEGSEHGGSNIVEISSNDRTSTPDYSNGPFIPECELLMAEADWLYKFKDCKKNAGHEKFASVDNFLPLLTPFDLNPSQKKALTDYIGHVSAITARVTTLHTSEQRPEFFPGTRSRYPYFQTKVTFRFATGFLVSTLLPQRDNTNLAWNDPTPPDYWLCLIATATHAICDLDEAQDSTFEFFYDQEDSKDKEECAIVEGTDISITEFRRRFEDFRGIQFALNSYDKYRVESHAISILEKMNEHPLGSDTFIVVCSIEDKDKAIKLQNIQDRWVEFRDKPSNELLEAMKIAPTIVSHPHGGPKLVSIGQEHKLTLVNLKECINSGNAYLERYKSETSHYRRKYTRCYSVVAETDSPILPFRARLYPPSPFDQDDLPRVGNALIFPKGTKVELHEGDLSVEHSFWAHIAIPMSALMTFLSFKLITDPTPVNHDDRTDRIIVGSTERLCLRLYEISSAIPDDILTVGTLLILPRLLYEDDVHENGNIVIPARTNVYRRREDKTFTRMMLWKDMIIPKDSLELNVAYNLTDPTYVKAKSVVEKGKNPHKDFSGDRVYRRLYKIVGDSLNPVIPPDTIILTPGVLCADNLKAGTDDVTLPARTEVWTPNGPFSLLKYSLRRATDIPVHTVILDDTKYCLYDTPTCPGSSGAMIPHWFMWVHKFYTHSGATGRKNKSGIDLI